MMDADMIDNDLTPLHPNYKTMLRINAAIFSLFFVIGAAVLEFMQLTYPGLFIGPVLIIALIVIIRLPMRRYAARGYSTANERLRVVRGIWWRGDTVVPYGRVQHIDVNRGPLERAYGLATLTVHTAGTHGASVHLPGLAHETALTMRDEIRAHIKREMI